MNQQYERNIRLYGLLKVFTKRVFLPLTTIYLVEVGHLTLSQVGILASLSAVVSLACEVPTGYFADRYSRRSSLMMAASLATVASLVYAAAPQFPGAVCAIIIEAVAYSFLNGAGEALMHDTLHHLGRIDDYPRIVGRAQSLSLVGNMVLVALVPLTYPLNHRLPFLISALAYLFLLAIVNRMTEPPRLPGTLQVGTGKDLVQQFRYFVNRFTVVLFFTIGLLTAFNFAPSDFINLSMRSLGLAPARFGIVFAASSMLGVVGGLGIHHLRKLSLRSYMALDLLLTTCVFLAIGFTHSLPLVIAAFCISMASFRLRSILYQHKLLLIYKDSRYKATLISVLSVFDRGNEIWIPFVFVAVSARYGLASSFAYIGLGTVATILPLSIVAVRRLRGLESA